MTIIDRYLPILAIGASTGVLIDNRGESLAVALCLTIVWTGLINIIERSGS